MKELLTNIINKIQQIAEKLGLIADYVVEQGTSGNWTYRKWNSGIAECWGNISGSFTISTATGALYYCYSSVTFPSRLFTEIEAIDIDAQSNYGVMANTSTSALEGLTFYLQCATSVTAQCYISFNVKGRWK